MLGRSPLLRAMRGREPGSHRRLQQAFCVLAVALVVVLALLAAGAALLRNPGGSGGSDGTASGAGALNCSCNLVCLADALPASLLLSGRSLPMHVRKCCTLPQSPTNPAPQPPPLPFAAAAAACRWRAGGA